MGAVMSGTVQAKVMAWLAEAGVDLTVQPSDLQRPLQDLGVDSLAIFEILELLEEKTGTTIDDEVAGRLRSLSDIIDYVSRVEVP